MSSKLDYLQKYLSAGDSLPGKNDKESKKAKKKKKKKTKGEDFGDQFKSRIIDEDEAFDQEYQSHGTTKKKSAKKRSNEKLEDDNNSDNEILYGTMEEQPQIAGFIDERPEIEIMKERFTTSSFQPVIKVEDNDDDTDVPCLGGLEAGRARIKDEPLDIGYGDVIKKEPPDDISPPRIRGRRHDSSSDDSPPRRRRRHDSSDSDNSPPRTSRHDSSDGDISPPRLKRTRDKSDSDNSPPRRKSRRASDSDNSPPRTSKNRRTENRVKSEPNSDSDMSPPRVKREKNSDDDLSPPRNPRIKTEVDSDGDISPPRIRPGEGNLMTKTLDGKKAGLQNAKALKEELEKLKKKEKIMFEKLSSDISGRGAETKVRGRLKEKEEEEKRRKAEHEISEEVKKKYSRWNRGVKQTQEIQAKITEDLREMDKPMARAADDVDLDAHLKNIERAEDPMFAYMKKKRAKLSGAKKLPTYQGPPPAPNRFKIPPGYRWDGVDRSNGFEKKLFQRQNDVKAVQEDAYKWSTEDM